MPTKTQPYSPQILFNIYPQPVYQHENLLQIALPLGGIGAGTLCINGYGGLQDFSIHHKPNTSAMPDGHGTNHAAFALLHFPDSGITRLVEGPYPKEAIYNQGLKSQGLRNGGQEGFPRLRQCSFSGEYPFGSVSLADSAIPVAVNISAYNPFIPGDVKNSSIPCAILEYSFTNTSDKPVTFEFSYHLSHLASGSNLAKAESSRNAVLPDKGVYFYNVEEPHAPTFGSASLTIIGEKPCIKGRWFRGGWFDALSALWREVSDGKFQENDGAPKGIYQGRNGGSVMVPISLQPEETKTIPVLITWHFPNVDYSHGLAEPQPCECEACECETQPVCWQPYYVAHWQNAQEVCDYVHDHYQSLKQRTQAFHDAFFRSTLPWYVKDAISANLGIMKSPTVLLQKNGNMWAWEGCFCDRGCCAGSCTHVWNYAQAFPYLFPSLERTLREQELERSMNEAGHITFRAALPDGQPEHKYHAASDGQLGGIMKVYREWQISGDRQWLQKMYPLAKKSLDFCIQTWDPRHTGVLMEPHHNTYDIEFWGPDGMCSSFYIGALCAFYKMAEDLSRPEEGQPYLSLAEKGVQYLDAHLFNGEYYEQKVMTEGLDAFAAYLQQLTVEDAALEDELPEEIRLLQVEGPKYQYGTGCISDGVIGHWLAAMCYLESIQTKQNVLANLQSIFKYNFKDNLWNHANPQRPGYALGDEAGLLLCTWPQGGKPTLPFVYSDEVWTGIEYQVAAHLIMNGQMAEGLSIVWATRDRYDGHTRNPWNEYECGNYYARAMASYSLLYALSGIRYSAVTKKLEFAPQFQLPDMNFFFAHGSSWGNVAYADGKLSLQLQEGGFEINSVDYQVNNTKGTIAINHHVTPEQPLEIALT